MVKQENFLRKWFFKLYNYDDFYDSVELVFSHFEEISAHRATFYGWKMMKAKQKSLFEVILQIKKKKRKKIFNKSLFI